MSRDTNPFSTSDADRHAIWEMLVRKDIDGFVAQEWSIFADCFKSDGFAGLDAKASLNCRAPRHVANPEGAGARSVASAMY